MTILLFPGRHLLNTRFQAQYLQRLLAAPPAERTGGERPFPSGPIDQIVFAITSSNQSHSRYNPIPFHVRAIGVDRLARGLKERHAMRYRIIGIPHYRPTPRFADHTLQEIEQQTEGNLRLTPDNCIVICSTEGVREQYEALGFAILPAEMGLPEENRPQRPIELLQHIVAAGEGWAADPAVQSGLAPATYTLWHDFPDVPRRILRLWRDPLLTDSGDLTGSRDYASYTHLMSNSEIISLKYEDIKAAIVPGKIVDEGCGDGALLVPIARDFPDSDLLGIEITGEFIARGRERQRAGEFGGSFIHFHQRNITERIFEDQSIDTTLCNSTIHELWSYGDQAATVYDYLAKKYRQTAPGGRLIIRDVVGPADKEQEVYLWLNDQDGHNDNPLAIFDGRQRKMTHLQGLSTYGRFLRFAHDFLAELRDAGKRGPETEIRWREEMLNGRRHAVLSLRAAVEFMSKKDYTNNWGSEMNEEFAFWNFGEWKTVLRQAGFQIVENPNEPAESSRVYTNPWIVENRWQGKVALFEMKNGRLEPLPFPPTNIVLISQRTL